MEIKDKKGTDNVIANHLSRLEKPIEDERGIEIEENIPNIVNFLACGIMSLEFIY